MVAMVGILTTINDSWILYLQTSEVILSMSNEIVKSLIEDMLEHVACLYVLTETVSVLDMLQVKL